MICSPRLKGQITSHPSKRGPPTFNHTLIFDLLTIIFKKKNMFRTMFPITTLSRLSIFVLSSTL